jgi:hypothetical protein
MRIDQLDGLLLHFEHQTVDPGAEVAIEHHAWDGHDQAQRRVVQGDRNAVRERDGIRRSVGLRSKYFDHADDGAEQAQQRRHRGNGAQRRQEPIEFVTDDATDFLDRFLHHRTRTPDVGETCGKHATQGRLTRGLGEQFRCEPRLLVFRQHLVDQPGRCHHILTQ